MLVAAYALFVAFLLYIIIDTVRAFLARETRLYRDAKARAQRDFYYSVWAVKDKQIEDEQRIHHE